MKKIYRIEFSFGVVLITCHFLMWLLPSLIWGMEDPSQYYFLSIFPMWFVLSVFGTFVLVMSMIIIFVLLFRKELD